MKSNIVFPPSLVMGTIDDKEIKINYIDNNNICFVSADKIDNIFKCCINIFSFDSHGYEAFCLNQCEIIEEKETNFSYAYLAKIVQIESSKINQYYKVVKRVFEYLDAKNKYGVVRKIVANGFLDKDYEVYPFKNDNEFYESIQQQYSDWYEFDEIVRKEKMEEIVANVEFAFNINSFELYKQFSDMEIEEAIQNNLEKSKIISCGIFVKPFSRIYIGNEFCPNIFPSTDKLITIMNKAHKKEYGITLASSYLNEDAITILKERFEAVHRWCMDKCCSVEVVVNDWGVLNIIKDYTTLTPILGRLLNRRKKDPRTSWWWGFDKISDEFMENNLNCKHFADYLHNHKVDRYEYESCINDIRIAEGDHSLHFPFYQINTSAFCLLNAHCNLKKPELVSSGCSGYCSEFYFKYPKHLNMIGKGTSIFGFDKTIFVNIDKLKAYIEGGVDRLVCSVW